MDVLKTLRVRRDSVTSLVGSHSQGPTRVLRGHEAQRHRNVLAQTRGPVPRDPDAAGRGRGPRSCVSDAFPGGAEASGLDLALRPAPARPSRLQRGKLRPRDVTTVGTRSPACGGRRRSLELALPAAPRSFATAPGGHGPARSLRPGSATAPWRCGPRQAARSPRPIVWR